MKRLLLAAGLGLTVGAAPLAASAAAVTSRMAVPTTPTAATVEPAATQALDKMSAYLSTLSAFELQSQTSLDIVTQDGQRITLDGTAKYKAKRPDGLVLEIVSDRKSRTFVYDGKQLSVVSPQLGYYATVAAPPTIRQMLDQVRAKYGISLPLDDLFRWNDPASRTGREQVSSAFAVGDATIDGVATTQYAFREGKIDWQVWIEKGDKPLPRKLVIIDHADEANPTYTAVLSWNTSPTLTAEDFAFRPPQGAKRIPLEPNMQQELK
jgi:hypothetical protein